MDPDLPPLTQTDWFREFEAREWVRRMDDHYDRYMRDRPPIGPEEIRRAIWGRGEEQV